MSMRRGAQAATVAAAAIVGAGSGAEAATIITLPLNAVLTNGASFSGSFDISGLLNDGASQYQATDAKIEVSGTSDFGVTGYAHDGSWWGYSYSYSCGSFWSSRTCYGYASYPNYVAVDGVQDSLQVLAAGESGTGYDGPSGNGYYTNYYGDILAQVLLNGSSLSSANATGSLAFSATGSTNTSVRLNSARLTLTLEQVAGAVPEPGTWGMMLLGFGAIGAAMRRERRRAKRTVLV